MLPVTAQAHEVLRQVVRPGEVVIDATAGNGQDTRFLAELVGPAGQVHAIDIQPAAIELARTRLLAVGLMQVVWHVGDHARLREWIPESQQGQIAAVMFNLGYWPGGNKSIITTSTTTLTAVRAALEFLRPGGVVTIMAYTGHPGGQDEANSLESLLVSLPPNCFRVERGLIDPAKIHPPRLYVVRKVE